ncbi:hypothetical protein NDU88_000629 [Pleurodeles waltl]|uniref:Uncharacterized protein n=1 Tax=Pleurodeles waltl TaxID=8319 RepID=A0AAV7VZ25_PLEWA|nr:hypothetical protein NDU88_000629 [Pleurodeles waltl]
MAKSDWIRLITFRGPGRVVLVILELQAAHGESLDRDLTQQEDALAALQRQVDNGDASESYYLAVLRIENLWGRLDNHVHWDFRQRLFREGDRSGHMLVWLLRQECLIPIILALCGLSGEKISGQLRVNLHLREHLGNIYALPQSMDGSWMHEYLDRLRMPHLSDAQVGELEGEVSLEELQEALDGMASEKAPGPTG